MPVTPDQKVVTNSKTTHRFSFPDLLDTLSVSRGWDYGTWQNKKTIRLPYGGNEVRFGVENTDSVQFTIVTEAYVWIQVIVNQELKLKIAPESNPAKILIPLSPYSKNDISLIRSSVSSGPFYVDAHLVDIETLPGGRVLPPEIPVHSTCLCTLGDSISGNSLLGPDQPFDPYSIGYGWRLCKRFGFQYLNAARDGSGVCSRLFENPIAQERLEQEVIPFHPDYLLVFYGTNDLAAGADPEEDFAPAYRKMMQTLHQKLPETKIACSALLWRKDYPREQITAFSRIILDTCKEMAIPCCDPFNWLTGEDFSDGLHPNQQGHQKLADHFERFLRESYCELSQE